MALAELKDLKLYSTHPHPCGYLDGEEATTLFIDPQLRLDGEVYSSLSMIGFRRSGTHVYRPHCAYCQACIPMRVNTSEFRARRNQKRCAKRNEDLSVRVLESINTDAHYSLYEKYITLRHADGDMYPPSRKQYDEFLCPAWGTTRYLEFRDPDDTLVAVAVCDVLQDGVSAIYTFYDPDYDHRSLGVFAVLFQISWAKQLKLPYVYLGYWIKRSDKMRYKADYKPHELFINNQWVSNDTSQVTLT